MSRKIYIVCAANNYDGFIIPSARHFDLAMGNIVKKCGLSESEHTQGFIDQFGKFYNRIDAMKIVKENGQKFNIERNQSLGLLYSEGLY